MRARPFGGLAVRPSLDPSFERAFATERGKDAGGAGRIVARFDHVSEAQRTGVIFRLAREAQQVERRAGGHDISETRTQNGAEDLAEDAKRATLGILLADMSVVRRNVADLVPKRESELRFIVHQPHQLAGYIDIAAKIGRAHV